MYELTTMALWESSQDPARRSEGLLRVHPWVSLGFSRGLREERAHEWTKGLATARRACKLALLVLPNRQGESHRTLAFVAVVFVHGHRGSSDSPAPRSVTRTKRSDNIAFRSPGKSQCATYWMISSTRANNDGGIVNPSALAVLRLMTSSNVVGCSTGRSPGLAPLKILSTYEAARRSTSERMGP